MLITESQEESEVVGSWSGTSICQLNNSGCHDESAYYRISKTKNPLIYQIAGYKIVNTDTLNMGILDFNYDRPHQKLSCINNQGVWTMVITGKKIEGELWTTDKILFRKISLMKN